MTKKNKYYAIKIGNGIENKIVTSWEECQKYVIGYPSIYKGFKNDKDAQQYLKNMLKDEVELQLMWGEIFKMRRIKEKLEITLGFKIPNYIVDEIIEMESKKDEKNLKSIINLAISNNRISKGNADKLLKYIQSKKSMLK